MSGGQTGETMRITLKVWRQAGSDAPGGMETYRVADVSPDMSFLERLDVQELDLGMESFEHQKVEQSHAARAQNGGAASTRRKLGFTDTPENAGSRFQEDGAFWT